VYTSGVSRQEELGSTPAPVQALCPIREACTADSRKVFVLSNSDLEPKVKPGSVGVKRVSQFFFADSL
jgi:hypothetical protein